MKRLVLASILFAAIGTLAHAAPVVGGIVCSDQETGRTCTQEVTCSAGSCNVVVTDFRDAICLPGDTVGDPVDLVGDAEGADPFCQWRVTDNGDDVAVTVTMTADDLPVELESASVE
jgi:hypothetical protein